MRWPWQNSRLKMSESEAKTVLRTHFFLLEEMGQAYRNRELSPAYFQKAETLCQQIIEMSPVVARAFMTENFPYLPRNPGFDQLAIIREKQGDFTRALAICEEAKRQGWKGDWDKRIDRLSSKLDKT